MIRLVLAEDQAMVRGALVALLQLEGDFEVVAAVGDGEAAWDAIEATSPDLLVTDIEMPGLTGLELAQRLNELASSTRVVILTTFARAGYLRRALDAGVRGYLLKDAPSGQLAMALRQVHAGGRSLIRNWPLPLGRGRSLTERERQVLRWPRGCGRRGNCAASGPVARNGPQLSVRGVASSVPATDRGLPQRRARGLL